MRLYRVVASSGILTVGLSLAFANLPGFEKRVAREVSPLFKQQLDTKLKQMQNVPEEKKQSPESTRQALLFVSEGVSACIGSACIGSGCVASACGGSGCGGSACAGSACPGSVCGGSACAGSVCVGSACGGSVCGGSACGASVCGGSACGVSGCGGSLCTQSACAGSLCGQSACAGSLCAHCPKASETPKDLQQTAQAASCPRIRGGTAPGEIVGLNVAGLPVGSLVSWVVTSEGVEQYQLFRLCDTTRILVSQGEAKPDRLIQVVDSDGRPKAYYELKLTDSSGRTATTAFSGVYTTPAS